MYNDGISIDPTIMMGKPCIAGTRITVELILENISAGESIEQLLESYPRLTLKNIHDALAFAAESLRSNDVYPIRKHLLIAGKPFIAGTNITIDTILDNLAEGKNYEQIIEAHPGLTRKAIQSALTFSAKIFSKMFKPKISEVLSAISR